MHVIQVRLLPLRGLTRNALKVILAALSVHGRGQQGACSEKGIQRRGSRAHAGWIDMKTGNATASCGSGTVAKPTGSALHDHQAPSCPLGAMSGPRRLRLSVPPG